MSERIRLPYRRRSPAFSFEHDKVHYRAQFSNTDDGRLMELFLNGGKEGSAAAILGQECSIILSLALQHGAPLETIIDALPKLSDGNPAGPVGVALKMAGGA